MVNRGNRNIFAFHVGGEPGDGFWHRQGYAMLFAGWQGDLTPVPTATAPFTATNETINVPTARNPDGSPVTGPVSRSHPRPDRQHLHAVDRFRRADSLSAVQP